MPPAQKVSSTPYALEPLSSTSKAISVQWTPWLLARVRCYGSVAFCSWQAVTLRESPYLLDIVSWLQIKGMQLCH